MFERGQRKSSGKKEVLKKVHSTKKKKLRMKEEIDELFTKKKSAGGEDRILNSHKAEKVE